MKKLVFLVLLFETSLIWAGGENLVDPQELARHHKITPLVFRFDEDNLCESGDADCNVAQNEVKGELIQEAIDEWNAVFNSTEVCLNNGGAGIGRFRLSGGSRFEIKLGALDPSTSTSSSQLKGYNTITSMASSTPYFDTNSGGVIDDISGEILEYNIVLPKNVPAGTTDQKTKYKGMVLRKIGQAIGLSPVDPGTGNLPCSNHAREVGDVTGSTCPHSSRGLTEVLSSASSTAASILQLGDKNAACLIYGGFFTGAEPTQLYLYERYTEADFSATNSQRFQFDVPEDMDHKILTVEVITNVGDQVQLDGTLTYPSGYFDFLTSDRTGAIRKILPAYAGTYMLEVNNPSGTTTNADKPMVVRAFLKDSERYERDDEDRVSRQQGAFKREFEIAEDETDIESGNFELIFRDQHHFLFRVLKAGRLEVKSEGDDDMFGSLCSAQESDSWSECVLDDDGGTDTNFKIMVNLDVGEYILTVNEYQYGSATYNLKYSFTVAD